MNIRKLALLSLLFAAFFVLLPESVSAKDEWLQVRSKNFFLIGNASEKEIRKAATRLEQFRETFRLVFGNVNLTASVPTNVVVFKSDSSYKAYKPKRGDGKIDNFIAGYFQPGEDVNYITLAIGGTDADTYGTIFHEYVHFIIDTNFGKSEVPPWFNEGLAEYYQTFEIEEDQKVKLGLPQGNHLLFLQQNQLIPLGTFFNISNQALSNNGNHSRSIFYAQAWALIHYLVQSGKSEGMSKFLTLTMANKPAEQAFQEAFGIGYAQMEKDLRKYVEKRSYNYHALTFKNKLVFDTDMRTLPMTEPESNAYLGDLLYRIRREEDAEPLLRSALAVQPDMSMANTSLGMIKIRQRKYDEAKTFLERAIAQDQKNHLALYRYAYLLSREGRDEFGFVNRFETATATKMRELLKKAIALNPAFTESYELFAFVSLVNNENLGEAAAMLQQALKYQPGNMRYAMRIAEIYIRQDKFKEAAAIADKLAKTADDADVRSRAENLANEIRQRQELVEQYGPIRRSSDEGRPPASGTGVGEPTLVRRKPGEDNPTEAQVSQASEAFKMRAINQSLRAMEPGEVRVLGSITKIECKSSITYNIKTDKESFSLSSKDFQTLTITTFVTDAGDAEVGCNSNLSTFLAVLSYRPASAPTAASRGELVALEFVPASFRLVDVKAERQPPTYVVEETGPLPTEGAMADMRRKAMIESINQGLRKPGPGERRELGFIERSECTNKGMFFYVKAGTQVLRLSKAATPALILVGFTPDIENLQVGCGMKQVEIPVVFTFKESTDTKAKVAGELISLEFVPKSFTLQ